MDFTIILKIAAVGIIVAILHQILSKVGREEYGMLVVLAGVVVILMMLIPQVLNLLDTVQSMLPMATRGWASDLWRGWSPLVL